MTMLFAMAAAPLLDWMFNGSPNITLDPKRRLEGIELEGWNIKGPPSYIKPPEGVGGLEQQAGAGETTLLDWTGKTEELAKTAPVKIPDNV